MSKSYIYQFGGTSASVVAPNPILAAQSAARLHRVNIKQIQSPRVVADRNVWMVDLEPPYSDTTFFITTA